MNVKKAIPLILLFFSTLLMQYCTNRCGSKEKSSMPIVSYIFNQVYRFINGNDILTVSSDSISMQVTDTVYFKFITKYGIVENGKSELLMACDPVPPSVIELGDSFKVYALDSFDGNHGQGSDLSVYFRILDLPYENGKQIKQFHTLSSFSLFNKNGSLDLVLIKKPETIQNSFRLKVFKQGKQKEIDTPVFTFY